MTISSRFAVAVHVLALLERSGGEPVPSREIAGSVNTNPAVVRRILSMLADAGITGSRRGAGGGALLVRDASEVTLLEVYRAVERPGLFAMHNDGPNPRCPVGRHIQDALTVTTERAERALESVLSGRTVAEVLGSVEERIEAEAAAR